MILHIESGGARLAAPKPRSRAGGYHYLGSKHGGMLSAPFHALTKVLKHVAASTEEAELGALCASAREGTIFRQALRGMGYPQAPTPIATDAATARAILGSGAPGRYLKGAGMRLHWMKDRAKRKIFTIKWKAAKTNLGHYPARAREPSHHRAMRPICAHNNNQSPTAMQGCASILGGMAAITRPSWLASMKRKGGTTGSAPQARSPAQHGRLKSAAGFSARHCHNAREPYGSASGSQQRRPASPYSALAWGYSASQKLRH